MAVMEQPTVYLLDYVAGNIRSLVNAIEKIGYRVQWIQEPGDIASAEVGFHRSVLILEDANGSVFRNSLFRV